MDYKRIDEVLSRYVRPQTFPLALKLCQSESELPDKVRMPVRDLGYRIALCQATGLARRFGWVMAVGKDDQCCIGGAVSMGFIPERSEDDPSKRLATGKYSHLLIAPVERANFDPDVIVVYGSPGQIMRLVQSAGRSFPSGAGLNVGAVATASADCGDIVARTTLSGDCHFILASGGDRIFGGTQDHEVIFAIPSDKVEAVLKGLEDTHKAGYRYPIITDLRHPPSLPPAMEVPKAA